MLLTLVALLIAQTDTLPGTLGPVRYFTSADDPSHVWLIDWTLEGHQLALIQLTENKGPYNNRVIAYVKKMHGKKEYAFVADPEASVLKLADEDDKTIFKDEQLKSYRLYGALAAPTDAITFVETKPPAGAEAAQEIVKGYIAFEGGPVTDDNTLAADAEKAINDACNMSIRVEGTGLAKKKLTGKGHAIAQGIADLCGRDAAFRTKFQAMKIVKFAVSMTMDLGLSKKATTLNAGIGERSIDTRGRTISWLKTGL
jgi:hypothetical protein